MTSAALTWLLGYLVSVVAVATPALSGRSDLAGLSLPMAAQGVFKVSGALQGRPAEVFLDTASPLTLVSAGCPSSKASSKASSGDIFVPAPNGSDRRYPTGELFDLQLGDRTLRGGTVGRAGPKDRCVVYLGLDRLAAYSIRWDVKSVTFLSKGTALPDEKEWKRVPLSRHPTGDWPIVVVRADRPGRSIPGPFLVSLAESPSRWSYPAEKVGLELFSSWVLPNVTLEKMAGKPTDALLGVLGADVLRRFDGVLDLERKQLALRPLENLRPSESVLERRASPPLEGDLPEPKD